MTVEKTHLLSVDNLTMRFGGLVAIDDLSLKVSQGEIRGLIGPNGAGKTTLFNAISGRHPATEGTIRFKDHEIQKLKPHSIAERGLARTFQHVTLFKNFSVLRNVVAGCQLKCDYSFWGALLNTRDTRRREAESEARALEFLDFVGLGHVAHAMPSNLPHGNQRTMGIAIALASEPGMLLLDEPCAGMNIEESQEMVNLIRKIRDSGVSVMLIEHDMKVIMRVCDNITVLNFGTRIAEGTPIEIRENPLVREAYLGSATDVA